MTKLLTSAAALALVLGLSGAALAGGPQKPNPGPPAGDNKAITCASAQFAKKNLGAAIAAFKEGKPAGALGALRKSQNQANPGGAGDAVQAFLGACSHN